MRSFNRVIMTHLPITFLTCKHITTDSLNPGFLPPANELCEGYVFTPVCQSFCSLGGVPVQVPPGTRYPPRPDTPPPPRTRYTPQDQVPSWDQVPPRDQVHTPVRYSLPSGAVHAGRYKRPVRILLECILV